ncbi:hypothetical protein P691DRAFT_773542 [Macrolepiota fuliginosa MF-IS2]|uniref:Uncharacterized protein n=1 Tax=Macrolepiota fuliginosa MF-IS2 TaxID=1400762 RepID=A0A9P6C717_9AGAR|nr:hypothetical protein P691DRAFT_773542 [Macrolepiota fuliginosa MF-IS2]
MQTICFATVPLDLGSTIIVDSLVFDVTLYKPALDLALRCATSALLPSTALAVSFDDVIISARDIVVFLCYDTTVGFDHECSAHAFHIPTAVAEHYPNIPIGNIFLPIGKVLKLPCGEFDTWSPTSRRRVVHTSWILLHEMSHCLGTMLYSCGRIPREHTPPKAIGFRRGSDKLPLAAYVEVRDGKFYGEKGFYLEDKLGGILGFLDDKETLVIIRPDQRRLFLMPNTLIDAFLRPSHENYEELFPLSVEYGCDLDDNTKLSPSERRLLHKGPGDRNGIFES